jgi:hypothetical protein
MLHLKQRGVRSTKSGQTMDELRSMTVRELIMALSQVEEAIRQARTRGWKEDAPDMAAADLAVLALRGDQIVHELRSRSSAGRSDGFGGGGTSEGADPKAPLAR